MSGAATHDMLSVSCRSLTQMGTEQEDFVTLSQRIGRKTGGVSFSPFTSSIKGSKDPLAFLMVRGKVMGDKSGNLLDIMRDVLLTAKLDDKERFKQVSTGQCWLCVCSQTVACASHFSPKSI